MWVWLTISMLLVIACIIFGIYSFIRSRTLQKSISPGAEYRSINIQPQVIKNGLSGLKKQAFVNFKIKLKSIEENSLLSAQYLNELKKRIDALESAGNFNALSKETKWDDSGEDWEKLYYETRKEKQSLENNLSNIKDALEGNMSKLQDLEKQQAGWAAMKSDLDSMVNEVYSLQNIIEELQRKVEGGREREKELMQESAFDKSKYAGYELMQKENNKLHSEIDMLTKRFEEIDGINILMQEKIKNLTEPVSTLEISEYAKMGIKDRSKI